MYLINKETYKKYQGCLEKLNKLHVSIINEIIEDTLNNIDNQGLEADIPIIINHDSIH